MWFILKWIVVVGAFAFRCMRKSFFWETGKHDVICYNDTNVKISKISNNPVEKTLFSIPLVLPHFKFTRETGLDEVFKILGFSEEYQTGDVNFDKRIYLACDHPLLHNFLRGNQKSRILIATLFSHSCVSISSDGEKLIVEFKGDVVVYSDILEDFINLYSEFNKVDVTKYRRLKDVFLWKVLIVESGIYSLLAYGYVAYAQYYSNDEDIYLEIFPLVKQGLWGGLGIALAILGIIFFVLKGSSRGHRIIIESIFVLGLAVPTSGISFISDINIELDNKPGEVIEAKLINWYERTHRRRGGTYTTYRMVIEPLLHSNKFHVPNEIKISHEVYKSLYPNGKVALEIGKGYLKHPWIKSIKFIQR